METSRHKLRRAARLSGPSIGLRRSKTDTTNNQAHPRPGNQAEGGADVVVPGLPNLQSTTPTLRLSSDKVRQLTASPDSNSHGSRIGISGLAEYAEIKLRASQAAEQSNKEAQAAETIESRAARVKAQVAGLTGNDESKIPISTERSKERPLTLQTRRHTAADIASSPTPQPAPRRNISDMEPVHTTDFPSEPHVSYPVLPSTRASSATGSDRARIEQDPFCKPWYSGSILDRILSEMGVESARSTLISLGITDLWLPLSKQLLIHL